MNSSDNDRLCFDDWTRRLNSSRTDSNFLTAKDEIIGLLHRGYRFIQSEDITVRRDALLNYLAIADRFNKIKSAILNDDEARVKARSILATHFFNIGPGNDWYFWTDVSGNDGKKLRTSIINFLCCSSSGIHHELPWYDWNYTFWDSMGPKQQLGSKSECRENAVISDFLRVLLEIVCSNLIEPEHLLASDFKENHDAILREVFIRAPWVLFTYRLKAGEVKLLEQIHLNYKDPHSRKFGVNKILGRYRVQNLPHQCLATRHETLLVLNDRLK